MFSGFVSRTSLRSFGSSTGIDVRHDRHGDQEDDQQHQHHVDERRRVDRRDRFVFVAIGGPTFMAMAYVLAQGRLAVAGDCCDDSRTACRSAPKPRTLSIAALLRRMSQL